MSGEKYMLLHSENAIDDSLARDLADKDGALVPCLWRDRLAPDILDTIQEYIYVPIAPEEDVNSKYRAFRRRAGRAHLTLIGAIPAKQVQSLKTLCEQETKSRVDTETYFRISAGPLRNMLVQVIEMRDGMAMVDPVFKTREGEETFMAPLGQLQRCDFKRIPEPRRVNVQAKMEKDKVMRALIIDGHNILYRAVHGNPSTFTAVGRRKYVGGCKGFYNTILRLKRVYPEYSVHIVFDSYDKEKFDNNPDYKANRRGWENGAPTKTQQFVSENRKWVEAFALAAGFSVYRLDGKEGDDVVGSLSTALLQQGYEHILVVSTDQDFYQLMADERVQMYLPKSQPHLSNEVVDQAQVKAQFGLQQLDKLVWLRALLSDKSDNIAGMSKWVNAANGTGAKLRASKEHLIAAVESSDSEKALSEAVCKQYPWAEPFFKGGIFKDNVGLMTLRKDLFKSQDLAKFKGTYDKDRVLSLLREVAFLSEVEMYGEKVEPIILSLYS